MFGSENQMSPLLDEPPGHRDMGGIHHLFIEYLRLGRYSKIFEAFSQLKLEAEEIALPIRKSVQDWVSRNLQEWVSRLQKEPLPLGLGVTLKAPPVYKLDLSSDARRMVTCHLDEQVLLWSMPEGLLMAKLEGHRDWVHEVCFSPDGRLILTLSRDGSAKLWEGYQGKLLKTLGEPGIRVTFAQFSWESQRLLIHLSNGKVKIWTKETGNESELETGSYTVLQAFFAPQGSGLLTMSASEEGRGHLHLWKSSEEPLSLVSPSSYMVASHFTPRGTHVVSTYVNGLFRIWEVGGGTLVNEFRSHSNRTMESLYFSPEGTLMAAVAPWEGLIEIWEREEGICRGFLSGHSGGINTVCFSPEGLKLLSASDDGTVRLWNALTGKSLAVLRGHEHWVYTAHFSLEGLYILSASRDGSAKLWEGETGELLFSLEGHQNGVNLFLLSPDGTYGITRDCCGLLKIWGL
jgi:WD40 repeat protein